MKHRALIKAGALALALLLAASQASATPWCSRGRESKPDHPCEDDDEAIDAAVTKFEPQWETVSGVVDVTGAQSTRGDYLEIRVAVDPPSLIPAVKAVLPTEADGFPVEVVRQDKIYSPSGSVWFGPGAESISLKPGVFDFGEASTEDEGSDSSSDPLTDAMLDDETNAWLDLPGVMNIEPAQCGNVACDPPKIAVSVQPSMMASVRKQIPSAKFGVPIELEPSR
jgi:hypothetical protein